MWKTCANCRNIIELIEECYNEIYSYINKEHTIDAVNELISKVNKVIYSINDFKMINNNLNEFSTCLEPKYEQTEDESVFLIRFHKEDITTKEMAIYIETINSMYETTCALLNISIQDYSLKPIKLESGSWIEKVLGHEKALKFLFDLLDRGIQFIYRNCTKEGKINSQENKINLLKQAVELTELCKEYGINTETAKETLEANLNKMCQDIYKLTTSSSKITVNEKIYDRKKEISEKALEEVKKLTIESEKEIVLE